MGVIEKQRLSKFPISHAPQSSLGESEFSTGGSESSHTSAESESSTTSSHHYTHRAAGPQYQPQSFHHQMYKSQNNSPIPSPSRSPAGKLHSSPHSLRAQHQQQYMLNSTLSPPGHLLRHTRTTSDSNNSFNDDSFVVQQPQRSSRYVSNTTNEDEDEDDEDEEEDDDDDDQSVSTASTASSFQPQQHPYYEQYKQYYASLAQQQQMYRGQFPMYPMTPEYMYPNMPYNPYMYGQYGMQMPAMQPQYSSHHMQQVPQSQQSPQANYPYNQHKNASKVSISTSSDILEPHQPKEDNPEQYLKTLKVRQIKTTKDDNELISNSRKSLIRSNRYPSEPISLHSRVESSGSIPASTRISSLASNFKSNETKQEEEGIDDEEDTELYDNDDTENNLQNNETFTEQRGVRFAEDEENIDEQVKEESHNQEPTTSQGLPTSESVAFALSDLQLSRKEKDRYVSDYMKLFDEEESDQDVKKEPVSQFIEDDLSNKDLESARTSNESNEFLSRKHSTTSDSSVGSIQSESHFKVAQPDEVASIIQVTKAQPSETPKGVTPEQEKPIKQKKKKSSPQTPNLVQNYSPRHYGSPTPTPGPQEHMMMNQMMANPMMEQQMYPDNRMSMIGIDSNRNSMMMSPPPLMNHRGSMAFLPQIPQFQPLPPPAIPKVSDSTINRKIQEFVKLRLSIRSGNKSIENRIKWVKALIAATNYKLYSFINVKGEAIPPEYSASSKAIFVSEAIKHLTRLLREIESNNKASEECKRDTYYIYGCLLKYDYDALYNQNFNIAKNIEESIQYFEKCLELNPNDHEALYKLGDIYEFDFTDDFERSLSYYKKSAKLGYNRAIYKVAMLYLEVPPIRSLKYFRYLRDLSAIDLNEIVEEERDEFSEVIGLALYQLGKIYEGKYPGDLKLDDEFIIKSLELAPVNYSKSLTYYNKSAKLNCLLAQVKLGSVYELGELNRQKNANKSIQWYLKAATSPLSFRRHPQAMLGLSRWSLVGSQGLSKHIPRPDPERAVMWCDRAIEEFEAPEAYYFMGELSSMGLSTVSPEVWYTKAYELGYTEAAKKIGV
ncbi:uncharacterized protein RJT21DRAFT_58250 [Scheffersomyces amazonensis]|uniref:uncharacterized protein n=1 Tax=Scheffersomyces amazonensis TaxID=1078765 RepID=UPI00315D71DE